MHSSRSPPPPQTCRRLRAALPRSHACTPMRRRLRLAGQLPACLPAFSPPACVARPSPSAPTNYTHTSQDIEATWESFIKLLDYNQGLARYGAPGRWNDLDMLEGGRAGRAACACRLQLALDALPPLCCSPRFCPFFGTLCLSSGQRQAVGGRAARPLCAVVRWRMLCAWQGRGGGVPGMCLAAWRLSLMPARCLRHRL